MNLLSMQNYIFDASSVVYEADYRLSPLWFDEYKLHGPYDL